MLVRYSTGSQLWKKPRKVYSDADPISFNGSHSKESDFRIILLNPWERAPRECEQGELTGEFVWFNRKEYGQ